MKIKYLIFLSVIFFLSGCLSNPKSSSKQEQLPITTGILVVSDGISLVRAQGYWERLVTEVKRFENALQSIEANVDPTAELYKMYQETFEENDRQYVLIEDKFSTDDFPKTFTYNNAYSRYDVSKVKEKYDIDELLFIKLEYGLLVNYYSVAVIGKKGYCQIYSEIINLKNNKLRHRKLNKQYAALDGKWNEGENYANLEKAVKDATTFVMQKERQNLSLKLSKGTRKK